MGEALLWGAVASSSLIIGGLLALRRADRAAAARPHHGLWHRRADQCHRLRAGGGGLRDGGRRRRRGARPGVAAPRLLRRRPPSIDRLGGADRKRSHGGQAGGTALAIVLGIVLDGVPESIVLGLTRARGEGRQRRDARRHLPLQPARGDRGHGRAERRRLGRGADRRAVDAGDGGGRARGRCSATCCWTARPAHVAFIQAFAGGAILTMLADTMMPEAFEHGGRYVGLATTPALASRSRSVSSVVTYLITPGRVSAQITHTSRPIRSRAQIG